MKDILKFGYIKLEEINKTVVYIKDFGLSKETESWSYNNTNFIVTYSPFLDGGLKIKRSMSGRVTEFLLVIGDKNNHFIVDNDVVKLFKDLEFFVYNRMSLKEYLDNNDVYYFVTFNPEYNEFSIDSVKLYYTNNDLGLFLSGNVFKDWESALNFANKINNSKLNIFEELKKRADREFKNVRFR